MKKLDESVRRNIIDASKTVFRKYGYAKVTMDDIAKTSGKGRSTLYYYFKNKHDVFAVVALEEYIDIIGPATEAVSKDNSLYENIYTYNTLKLDRLKKKVKEYDHLMHDLRNDDDFFFKIFKIVTEKELVLFKQLLLWAVENKDIAHLSSDDLKYLSLAVVTALASLEKEFILYGAIDDMTSRTEWMIRLLIKGLQ
ncbi:MAG: helix-turn-helix domain-containing protein [Leeuwenhoekiella sp.]